MSDFKRNYHTHTVRCHHACGNDEEYVLAAIEVGLDTLGFSEHTPYHSDNDDYRMSFEDAKDYFDSLLSLREKYRDKIKILIGFEAEYYESHFDRLLCYYKDLPIDYLILGQHFFDYDNTKSNTFHPTDDERLMELYFQDCINAINTKAFSYQAHPDAFKFTGDPMLYRKKAIELCEAAKKAGVPLELNLQGYEQHRVYPNDELWSVAGEVGCEVIVGADAHSPEALLRCQKNYREVVERFVEKYGLKLIDNLTLKKPVTR